MEAQDYSLAKMKKLFVKKDEAGIKAYVNKYFFKVESPVCVMYWIPSEDRFEMMTFNEVRDIFILKSHAITATIKGNKVITTFSLRDYFFNDVTKTYKLTMNAHEPKIFKKNGVRYINLASSYIINHRDLPDFDSYSSKVKKRVEIIVNHIRFALCGRDEAQFNYVIQWLAHAILGIRKMNTILYLKSIQGTGKSFLFEELIIPLIMGHGLAYTTADMDSIVGSFNKELMGKILLVLEEVPAQTKGLWMMFSNKLKQRCTGKTLNINEKNKSVVTVPNYLNIVILTNNNAVRLENGDRRYAPLDVSTEFVGNFEYFNTLAAACAYPSVPEAFCAYLKKIANPKFNERLLPVTDTKLDMINENLHPVYEFLKNTYLKEKQDIDCSFFDLYNEFLQFNVNSTLTKQAFSKLLALVDVVTKTKKVGNTTKRWIHCPCSELYSSFMKKHYIHDLDEINDPNNDEEEEDLNDTVHIGM